MNHPRVTTAPQRTSFFAATILLVLIHAGFRTAWGQSENDVVINEFSINPLTGKEYVELLVVAPSLSLQGWTVSDIGSRTGNAGSSEGDLTLPASAAWLQSVPRGTYIVIELNTPTANASTLSEDLSLTDATPRRLIIKTSTTGVTTAGTLDWSTNENIQLYAGTAFMIDTGSYGSPGVANAGVDDRGGALPLRFSVVRAARHETGVQLDWQVEDPEGCTVFGVERRTSAGPAPGAWSPWAVIATIPARSTDRSCEHRFTDDAPGTECQYRIVAWMSDARGECSPVVTVGARAGDPPTILEVYPNPAAGVFHVRYGAGTTGSVRIEIADASGRMVALFDQDPAPAGASGILRFDASGMAPGAYTCLLWQDGAMTVRRFGIAR